jgi:thiol-disulfide isomerase/thioredoxin
MGRIRCGHCKKLAPAWDELMVAYPGGNGKLVAEVDCTAAGNKPLCDAHSVKGFPSLKFGDPTDALQDYKGDRYFKALKKHVEEKLVPVCSPTNLALCDDAQTANISNYEAMHGAELEALVVAKEALLAAADAEHVGAVGALQKAYEAAVAAKEVALEEVKNSGLSLMRAVEKHAAYTAGKGEL